jgi:2-methylcitrate dehydratase PrpD
MAPLLRAAYESVPEHVLQAARLHLLDAISVGLLAARRGPVRGVRRLAQANPGACTVLGSPHTASAPVAVLVNGALIHSLEFDDTHVASVMHGSSVMAPVALAMAEAGDASSLLPGFAVGWELLIRLGLASPGRIQARGFQITSAAGAFAAAAASALMSGDDDTVVADALGIAGSQAGGTFAFLADGDTVKAAQPGWAAHSGLMASALARAGVSGPRRVFSGRYGFFELYADDPTGVERFADELADLGYVWHLPEAAFKLVPCCHYIHPFVEALLRLMEQGVTTENLSRLHCWVPTGAVPVVAEPWVERQSPASAHLARWSLPYVLALVLRDGHVSADAFDGECDGDVVRAAARIDYEDWPDSGFPARFPARLLAQLTDGTEREVTVADVRGGAGRPIEASDVIDKATLNLRQAGLPESAVAEIVEEFAWSSAPNPRVLRTWNQVPE